MDPPHGQPRAAPVMPSFASLRGPVRRSPVDVLMPPEPAPEPPAAPRPPEWTDLLLLARHVARWSLELPARGLRRVLGG
jgi:hypothetical protein